MNDRRTVQSIRRRAVASIKRMVKPFLHSSGYVDETSADGHVQLVVFKNYESRPRKIRYPVTHALEDGFWGFTADGVITDGFAGALVTLDYSLIALDDLLKLEDYVKKIKPSSYQS